MRFESLEEHLHAANLPAAFLQELLLYQDGLELWSIFEKYVTHLLDHQLSRNHHREQDALIQTDTQVALYWTGLKA